MGPLSEASAGTKPTSFAMPSRYSSRLLFQRGLIPARFRHRCRDGRTDRRPPQRTMSKWGCRRFFRRRERARCEGRPSRRFFRVLFSRPRAHRSSSFGLTVAHLLDVIRIAIAVNFHGRGGGFDVAKIAGGKFESGRADVFFQAVQFRGAGDGNDPRLLREQPRERDLRRRRFFPLRDLVKQIDQCLVGLAIFRREAGQRVAEVAAAKPVLSSILPVRKPLPSGL